MSRSSCRAFFFNYFAEVYWNTSLTGNGRIRSFFALFKGLRDLLDNDKVRGVWIWCWGDGWVGPYQKVLKPLTRRLGIFFVFWLKTPC